MDLHDGIMQDIYAATLGLELAFEDIDADPKRAQTSVSGAIDQLHNVIRDIRSYIFDLRPRQFSGDLGLALVDLGREFQENSQIKTSVQAPPGWSFLDHSVAVAYYIIAHEALSNARKHSHAASASISLQRNNDVLRMEVRDNSRGFDIPRELPEQHRGLRNMVSRAALIGATCAVESAPGQGTTIRVEIAVDGTGTASDRVGRQQP